MAYCGPSTVLSWHWEGSAEIPQQTREVLRIPGENPQLLGWDLNSSVGQSGIGSASGQWGGRAAKIRGGHVSAKGSPLFSQGRCGVSPAAPLTPDALLRVSPKEVLGTELDKELKAFPIPWTSWKC